MYKEERRGKENKYVFHKKIRKISTRDFPENARQPLITLQTTPL
jgi:hypothetical protein